MPPAAARGGPGGGRGPGRRRRPNAVEKTRSTEPLVAKPRSAMSPAWNSTRTPACSVCSRPSSTWSSAGTAAMARAPRSAKAMALAVPPSSITRLPRRRRTAAARPRPGRPFRRRWRSPSRHDDASPAPCGGWRRAPRRRRAVPSPRWPGRCSAAAGSSTGRTQLRDGDVVVEDGRIVGRGDPASTATSAVDCTGHDPAPRPVRLPRPPRRDGHQLAAPAADAVLAQLLRGHREHAGHPGHGHHDRARRRRRRPRA